MVGCGAILFVLIATTSVTSATQLIATGGYHACVLGTNGHAKCWGSNEFGQATPPTLCPTCRFTQIVSGVSHSCALRGNGRAVCWGGNRYGQATPPPQALFDKITAGLYFTCGTQTTGKKTSLCWGFHQAAECTSSNSKRATHTSVLLHYQTQQVLAKQQSLVEAKNYAPTAQMILFQSYRVWTHRERQSQVGFSRHRSLA
jgi:alpha-tubulin suppressor-like RCC1 family protein